MSATRPWSWTGDHLQIVSRSGDRRAPHDGNLVTLHTVRNFRALAY